MTSKESQQTKLSELSETDRFKAELATLLLYRAGFVELYGKIAGRHPDQINVSKKLLRTARSKMAIFLGSR
jgi:hypothetical protein